MMLIDDISGQTVLISSVWSAHSRCVSYRWLCITVSDGCGGCTADCSGEIDLAFLLDSASTVHAEGWHSMLDFVEWIVERLDVAADRTRVAVIYWSDSAYVGFTLNRYFVRQVRSVTLLSQLWRLITTFRCVGGGCFSRYGGSGYYLKIF